MYSVAEPGGFVFRGVHSKLPECEVHMTTGEYCVSAVIQIQGVCDSYLYNHIMADLNTGQ